MSHRALLRIAAAVLILFAAGCAEDAEAPQELFAASTPTASPTPSPTPEPSPTEDAEEDGGEESGDDSGQGGGDCAAYADSGGWCENGVGDYDCEGGSGNGPNYAPRDVEVADPGTDPFGLDDDGDGEGCEGDAPAPPPPAEPDTDPRFGTCGEAIDNGYGPYYRGTDPEYDWYRDADSDGVVCE